MHRTLKHTSPRNDEGPQGQRNVEIQTGEEAVAEPQKRFSAYLLAR